MKFIILNFFLRSPFPSQFLELLSPCSLAIWLYQLLTYPLCLKCSFHMLHWFFGVDDIPLSSLFPSFGSFAILLRFGLVLPLSALLHTRTRCCCWGRSRGRCLPSRLETSWLWWCSSNPVPVTGSGEPGRVILWSEQIFPTDFSNEGIHRTFIRGLIRVDAVGDGKAGGVHCCSPVISSLLFYSLQLCQNPVSDTYRKQRYFSFFHRAHNKTVGFMGTRCCSGQKCKAFRKELRNLCNEGSLGRFNVWHRNPATHLFLGTREMFYHNVDAFPGVFFPRFLIDGALGAAGVTLWGRVCAETPEGSWALPAWCCTFGLIMQHFLDKISLSEEAKRSELSGFIHMCMCRCSRLMMSVYNGQSHSEMLCASSLPIILQGAAWNLIKALLSILLPPQTGFLRCLNIMPR